ncbi:hypothetical protein [Halobacterium wangiae]|uniref:hypothetical protein n=1 Tax=Halobacterium wangiae TaxID=2902623 RepID=UPI001E361F05|nr:hypothetical protein [Halobacterium wangiae]
MARIGGVKVSDGGKIYWTALMSVLIGAPVGAWFLGWIRAIRAYASGLGAALGGVRETVVGFIAALFAGPTGAFKTAQDAFLASIGAFSETTVTVPSGYVRAVPGVGASTVPDVVQVNLGPFTFLFAAAIGVLSLWAFFEGVQRARGAF